MTGKREPAGRKDFEGGDDHAVSILGPFTRRDPDARWRHDAGRGSLPQRHEAALVVDLALARVGGGSGAYNSRSDDADVVPSAVPPLACRGRVQRSRRNANGFSRPVPPLYPSTEKLLSLLISRLRE